MRGSEEEDIGEFQEGILFGFVTIFEESIMVIFTRYIISAVSASSVTFFPAARE